MSFVGVSVSVMIVKVVGPADLRTALAALNGPC